MQKNFAISFSNFFLFVSLFESKVFRFSSCHMLDRDKLYDDVLKNRGGVAYKLIQRIVKTVTNFARHG